MDKRTTIKLYQPTPMKITFNLTVEIENKPGFQIVNDRGLFFLYHKETDTFYDVCHAFLKPIDNDLDEKGPARCEKWDLVDNDPMFDNLGVTVTLEYKI